MKVPEGNIFSHVCLSDQRGGGGPHVSITRDTLNLTVQGLALLPSRHETSLYSLPALPNLWTWDLTVQVPC